MSRSLMGRGNGADEGLWEKMAGAVKNKNGGWRVLGREPGQRVSGRGTRGAWG
jgi:hypothetical protein